MSRAVRPFRPPTRDAARATLTHLLLLAATACIAGAVAGILGLTNLAGFAFFLLSSVSVGGIYALANCGAKPGRYFVKPTEPLLAGTLSNCFSFILFWTCASAPTIPCSSSPY